MGTYSTTPSHSQGKELGLELGLGLERFPTTAISSRREAAVPRRLAALGFVGLMIVGASGCASDSKTASVAQQSPAAAAPGAQPPAPVPAKAGEQVASDVALGGGGQPATAPDANGALPAITPLGGMLAITAGITVEVVDVRKAVLDIPALVQGKGGAIYNTDIQVGDPRLATATITVKVPPADLESLIAGLGGVGTLVNRTQQTEDVSTQITDVEVRIATATASVDRIRALLADAKNLQDVTAIESELTARETTLEQLLAQQRNLDGRVQLATLTIILTPQPEHPQAAAGASRQSVGGAWRDGWNRFTEIMHGIAVGFAYAIPFLVLAGIGGGIAWWVRRRRSGLATPSTHATPFGEPL